MHLAVSSTDAFAASAGRCVLNLIPERWRKSSTERLQLRLDGSSAVFTGDR